MINDGVDSIEECLDVANYVKMSIKVKAALKVLFNENERLLLSHNRRFVLPSRSENKDSEKATDRKKKTKMLVYEFYEREMDIGQLG